MCGKVKNVIVGYALQKGKDLHREKQELLQKGRKHVASYTEQTTFLKSFKCDERQVQLLHHSLTLNLFFCPKHTP